jgi:hypothetical protein
MSSQVQLTNALNIKIAELGQVVAEHCGRHRDAERYLSLRGLGVALGARILGESGDDPRTAIPTAKPAATTPTPRRSPALQAVAGSCWLATPATGDSPTPCTSGRSARCGARPAPAPTNPCVNAAPDTRPHHRSSATDSSASCTAASGPAAPTMKPPHGPIFTTFDGRCRNGNAAAASQVRRSYNRAHGPSLPVSRG